ncbi:hypothetical protein Sulku_2818 (plasmid) [Sulfuricurvum kujiense DSM 16994]|uniref:Uncharacterized protein n=1 Tax=Sulfuricurvum kujiense (strain ATCC BAA-921 / DSM 16994 / JCM 11577 / YK-1) TaxID=709032 RepID=E4U450_SULKY|nr:hypothetical protein [Sulfuricurvum kujiense]ADR35466.1 hypothetical protein Sulku_2818 [Sulfuricurvum kujiense DSM 16994]
MLTDRDLEMIKFTNIYGRTFLPVLGRTFFPSEKIARDRIAKLVRQKIVRYIDTDRVKIGRAVVLTHETQKYLVDIGLEPKKVNSGWTTINHNIIEQTAHYWLSKLGEVERTSVAKHGAKMEHVPDMILTLPSGGRVFVEVETSRKARGRYDGIFEKIRKEDPAVVLYVLPKEKQIQSFAKFLPEYERVRVIDIDTLIENVKTTGKVSAKFQHEF